ncbi:cell division protein FtsX [Salidesulfovibrio brasiliensis]|uniref:cell division protein FtsX n=1 Tax=Salidesulfovibrio brasiliensis TaxID=221711 RepID=UPI001FE1B40E|nr:FtsX-like permease family protein [Salidesulfovibrio brasiliensis]
MTRRDEVEILSLVGAKPWYIRWPLLTGGFLQGVLGSAAGLGLLLVAQNTLKDALNIPPLFLQVRFLPLEQCVLLAGGVVFVSLAASWVAVR